MSEEQSPPSSTPPGPPEIKPAAPSFPPLPDLASAPGPRAQAAPAPRSEGTRRIPLIAGAIWGIVYGVMLQLLFRAPSMKRYIELMSVGMIFLLPVAIGFLVVFYVGWRERDRPLSFRYALLGPWSAVGPCLILSFVVGWEGAFCLMFATPVFLIMSSLGGLLAKLALLFIDRNNAGRGPGALKNGISLLLLVLLAPLTSGFVESNLQAPEASHRVLTQIEIAAPVEVVWSEIIRVRRIEPSENQGLFYKLGFPKPIEATLSHEGVGGVRNASFEKGLLFIETVTEWQPQRLLSFRIQADAHMTRLDPHVVVGGQYFDVLQGTYEITPGPRPGTVTLNLWSRFRLNTHFNGYAGFLGDSLMRDIQNSILRVLKKRCEGRGSAG
jgi:hypothetical protein